MLGVVWDTFFGCCHTETFGPGFQTCLNIENSERMMKCEAVFTCLF